MLIAEAFEAVFRQVGGEILAESKITRIRNRLLHTMFVCSVLVESQLRKRAGLGALWFTASASRGSNVHQQQADASADSYLPCHTIAVHNIVVHTIPYPTIQHVQFRAGP